MSQFTISRFSETANLPEKQQRFAIKVGGKVVGELYYGPYIFTHYWVAKVTNIDFAHSRGYALLRYLCFYADTKEEVLAKFKKTLDVNLPKDERIWRMFEQLSSELSPENISFDGEREPEEVEKARAEYMKVWHKLENELGFKVSEHDVWARQTSNQRMVF